MGHPPYVLHIIEGIGQLLGINLRSAGDHHRNAEVPVQVLLFLYAILKVAVDEYRCIMLVYE